MNQMTFSGYEYSIRKRKTKREEFLDIMNENIPWKEEVEFVRPCYGSGGEREMEAAKLPTAECKTTGDV